MSTVWIGQPAYERIDTPATSINDGGADAIVQTDEVQFDTGRIDELPEKSTKYRTTGGDRWDTIAVKAYGDVSLAKIIIAANPTVPITPVLQGGLELFIPIVPGTTVDKSLLPPWKR